MLLLLQPKAPASHTQKKEKNTRFDIALIFAKAHECLFLRFFDEERKSAALQTIQKILKGAASI